MTPLEKREQLIRMFGAYSVRLEQIFDDYYNRLARIGLTEEVLPLLADDSALFSFARVPEVKSQLDNVFDDFVNRQMGLYRTGIADGAILAIEHDSALLEGYSVLSETALKTVRNNAVQGFLRGRLSSSRGLSLSQLVWNYASQAKSEFEVAITNVITQGLQEGTSAEELGRKVREQLNNPDMMYRRYHEKVVMSDGTKKDVAVWRRRVIDEDGRVRFVKEPLEKVGMGHYRSARKNALRLMRTEINASYHNANYERWQQEPFVIGIRIFLSPQHPEEDECDYLAGNYPKDFYWTGWHPACMCASAPITLQGEEKKDYYRRVALGEDMSDYVSPNAITDVPDGYKEWVAANAERIRRADNRGKLAWHLEDNREYWEGIVKEKLAYSDIQKLLNDYNSVPLKQIQNPLNGVLFVDITGGVATEVFKGYTALINRYYQASSNAEKVKILKDIRDTFPFKKLRYHSSAENSVYGIGMDDFDKKLKEGEMPKNLVLARKAVFNGFDVYLLSNPNTTKSADFIFVKKGNLYYVEGKTATGKNSLDHNLNDGAKQSDRLVIDVVGNNDTDYVFGNLKNAYTSNKDLKEVMLFKGKRLISVKRDDVLGKNSARRFRKIWEQSK